MVVAADVKNMDNMLLMPAGCEITEKHIGILSAWGVYEIQVEACDGVEPVTDALQQMPPETLNELKNQLQHIFWDPVEANLVQAEVFKLALLRRAKQTPAKAS